MSPDEKDGRMDRAAPSQDVGSASVDEMREQLREAIRAQERLQDQLRAAVSEFSQAIAQQQRSAAVSPGDREFQRLESRLRGVEQRLNRTSEQVQAILQSRIWRTLVKVGGVLLRFQKLRR
jgi:DNA repair exonuclease SbcCD ATPase subunit